MKTLEESREELNKDPVSRRKLAKLEKEYKKVTEGLTKEELEKYGLNGDNKVEADNDAEVKAEKDAEDVIDYIGRHE